MNDITVVQARLSLHLAASVLHAGLEVVRPEDVISGTTAGRIAASKRRRRMALRVTPSLRRAGRDKKPEKTAGGESHA